LSADIVWLAPLLILPGIGLLIVSTSNRFSDLHEEIHNWLHDVHDRSVIEELHMVKRAGHFRNALVALYTAVFFFVVASLVGAVLDFMELTGDIAVFSIAFVGIIAVGFASLELIRESMRALEVIQFHVDHIMEEMEDGTAD
jgi:hypothetical protein